MAKSLAEVLDKIRAMLQWQIAENEHYLGGLSGLSVGAKDTLVSTNTLVMMKVLEVLDGTPITSVKTQALRQQTDRQLPLADGFSGAEPDNPE